MDALPYYKWHWRDYRANRRVQRMSWQARAHYRALLDELWAEGSLPVDHAALADIADCPLKEFEARWDEMAGCWEERDGRLYNAKMDEQRTTLDKARVAMSIGGENGGKACNSATRGKGSHGSNVSPQAYPKPTLSLPQAYPDIAKHEHEHEHEHEQELSKTTSSHPAKSGKSDPAGAIYGEYPLKVGPRVALKAIANAHKRLVRGESPQPPLPDRDAWVYLLRAVREYAKSPLGTQADKSLIPHPSTWFNASRYLDDRSTWAMSRDGPASQNPQVKFGNLLESLQQQGAV